LFWVKTQAVKPCDSLYQRTEFLQKSDTIEDNYITCPW